jgi:hypothetical protein
MSEVKQTQYRQIIDYLNKHGSITPAEAWDNFGISKLATRISEMRLKKGMKFKIEYERGANRSGVVSRYARYSWGEE